MPPETWTVASLLRSTREFLQTHGSPSARLDAELLLAHVLGATRMDVYTQHDRPVEAAERDALRALVKRRAAGEPVAYLLGERGFWTLDLRVDGRVLIPRPETERLVELALAFVGAERARRWRVVDVGTGSGAIALALASELPSATVLGIDASADALQVAAENAERTGLRDRVRLVRGDLLAPLVRAGSRVELVVSNPPYVGTEDGDRLAPDVRRWEPAQALFAGLDGLDLIRRLLPEARACLVPGGLLLVEIGSTQGEAVAALAREAGLVEVSIERDLAGLDRVLRARAPGELALPDGAAEASSAPAEGAEEPAPADPAAGEASDAGAAAEVDVLEALRASGVPIIDVRDDD